MYELLRSSNMDMGELYELVKLTHPVMTMPLRYGTTESTITAEVFRPFIHDLFPGEWTKCFCAVLWQDGTIMPHADMDVPDIDRQHLILSTNKDAWYLHDNHWAQLVKGNIYSMNPTKIHAAVNWGAEPRVSLIIDRVKEVVQ